MVQNLLRTDILNLPEFSGTENKGPLDSYSVINLSATHTINNGCTKGKKDLCGLWKSKGCVSGIYDNIKIPFSDAKLVEKLCIGGP